MIELTDAVWQNVESFWFPPSFPGRLPRWPPPRLTTATVGSNPWGKWRTEDSFFNVFNDQTCSFSNLKNRNGVALEAAALRRSCWSLLRDKKHSVSLMLARRSRIISNLKASVQRHVLFFQLEVILEQQLTHCSCLLIQQSCSRSSVRRFFLCFTWRILVTPGSLVCQRISRF